MKSPGKRHGFTCGTLRAHPYGPWLHDKVHCIKGRRSAGPDFQVQSATLLIHFTSTPSTTLLASDNQWHRRRYHIQSTTPLIHFTSPPSTTLLAPDNQWHRRRYHIPNRHELTDQLSITQSSSTLDPFESPSARPTPQSCCENEKHEKTSQKACSERERFFQDLDAERRRVDAVMHSYARNNRSEGSNNVRFKRDCCDHLRQALFLEECRRYSVEKKMEAQSQARIIAEARAEQEASWRFKIEERLENQRRLKHSAERARIVAEVQAEEEARRRRIFELEARVYADMQARLRAERDEVAHLEMEARIQAVLETERRREVERLLSVDAGNVEMSGYRSPSILL